MAIGDAPYMNATLAAGYERLGIRSVADLLRHYPSRYEKRPDDASIEGLVPGQACSTAGMVARSRWVSGGWGRSKGRFEAVLEDETGVMRVIWFNSPFLRDRMPPGVRVSVSGKVRRVDGMMEMVNPRWKVLAEDERSGGDEATGPLWRSIYPTTEGLSSDRIWGHVRRTLGWAAEQLEDPLPEELRKRQALSGLAEAFRMIHLPASEDEQLSARRRLAYNELLLLQLGIQLKKAYVREHHEAPVLAMSERVDGRIRARLPFTLTAAQDEAVSALAADMGRGVPMNRLLQGDVGAGKTLVAVYAMLLAASGGWSSALMAPTEVLATQHYGHLCELLRDADLPVDLVMAGAETPVLTEDRPRLLVGTQALLNREGLTDRMALVVIDEQHRFGVKQRGHLRRVASGASKGGVLKKLHVPHQLVMTATPIPRTLALTLFGDLEVSTIAERPAGRRPVETRLSSPDQIGAVLADVLARVEGGEPGFVVLPTIDDREGGEGQADVKGVEARARQLMNGPLGAYGVEVAHGRMSTEQRRSAMERFVGGKSRVLVATTVIEVGVDVPDAGWMVIEQAERFGLAQLHQLRGRIGRKRGETACVCHLVATTGTESSAERMAAMVATTDGFEIAERDLAIRGMGEFYGTRQAGASPLRVARLPEDEPLLRLTARDAKAMIAADPSLRLPEHAMLRKVLKQQMGDAIELIDVG